VKVLGIETSCDECAAAVVEDGEKILSNVVASQIPFHAAYSGVVPEIASRKHTEWVYAVVQEALEKACLSACDIDAVAATNRPGLVGSLIVGLSFAKAFAWARRLPFIAVDHMLAHLYAPRLAATGGGGLPCEYPFLGLLVSGGHTIILRADGFDDVTVLGTTIDDAAGEAFDKVAKHYGFGYPGGKVIDELSRAGDSGAFNFPMPRLHKGGGRGAADVHRYDVSYSGLKTAVINQLESFRVKKGEILPEDIAASFQKTAVDILLRALFNAADDTGLKTVAAGGGVAANSYLRAALAQREGLLAVFPPFDLCTDNGAMVAGIAYHYLARGDRSPAAATASSRVDGFKKKPLPRRV